MIAGEGIGVGSLTGRPVVPISVVLTGQVDRLALFRPVLDHVGEVPEAKDFGVTAIRGQYDGVNVVVVGTGMGGPATARAVALARSLGANPVVRAGGAGPVRSDISTGDHIVATAAVRDEGSSTAFLPMPWPAVAHPDVVDALEEAAEEAGMRVRLGVVHSKDAFFAEIDPDSSPVSALLHARWSAWQRLGVLVSEMEAATLFAAATRYGLKAGAILRVNDVHYETGGLREAEAQLCTVAVAAAARVAAAL